MNNDEAIERINAFVKRHIRTTTKDIYINIYDVNVLEKKSLHLTLRRKL
jgi:hypothetical protein